MKKIVAMLMGISMMASLLTGCGGSSTGTGEVDSVSQTTEQSSQSSQTSEGTEAAQSTASEGEKTVLKLYGPGLFTTVGETGSKDIVTGVTKPGYDVVIERWAELHPETELQIETIPWDNWKAACQTAALSGDVDIILHGASIVPVCEPLTEYLEKEPEVRDAVGMMAMRKNAEIAPLSEYVPYGLTVTVNPIVVVIDKEIFEHYNVELPDYKTWTLQDVQDLAKATTGTDPVTGKQTYGMSMIAAGSANKNYIWASRAMNSTVFEWGDTLGTTKADFVTDKTAQILDYLNGLEEFASPDYIEGLDKSIAYTPENNLAMSIVEDAYSAYNTIKAAGLEDKYMFAALPNIEGGTFDGITSSHMGDWNMAISNTSKNKDLAWEFMKFMVTDEVIQQWILDTYSVPANKAASGRLKEYMPAEYADTVSYIVETSPLEFSASANDSYDSSNFGTYANDITTVLNEMFQGNMDAQAAMEYVQKNLNDYMSTLQ